MKKIILFFALAQFVIVKCLSQCPPASTATIANYLDGLRGQVNDRNFNKIAFADFSKFLIGEDNQFGRAINYASIQVDKPKATLNLYQNTKDFGFFNFVMTGGFENDLFSVVSAKKPATTFSGTLSYSVMPWKSYKFYPIEKHAMWSRIAKNFDDSINTECIDAKIADLDSQIKVANDFIDNNFYKNPQSTEIDQSKHQSLIDSLLTLNILKKKLDSLTKEKTKRTNYVDSLALSAKWSTRKWFWITFAGNYGGLSFKYYNKNSTNGKLLSDVNSFTRSGTLSINLLYKSIHPWWLTKFLNNSLITAGLSFERKNNFSSFTGSEYKSIEKIDSVSTNTQYTKTQTYNVYTDILKEYNSTIKWLEIVKLFGENGVVGLRNRLSFEKPESKSGLQKQSNWDVGFLFNTTSKKDKDVTKFSIEVFATFKDLSGNNVKEEDKPQKWSDRHTIGVRTNIPFRFLSL